MTRLVLASTLLSLPLLLACPDPPPDIAQAVDEGGSGGSEPQANKGGPEGDPSAMDLSPGGTTLLDISQVVPQRTQEELKVSGEALVTLSGDLRGSCDGGTIRIDVIEVGVEHTDSGPMVGPVTALFPERSGEYSLVTPAGKSYQVSALCDIDNDGKIVQDKDKLAPGVAIGEISEDRDRIHLVFPGEGDEPVQIGDSNDGTLAPPGDNTASLPSAEAGARDRDEAAAVPPPPAEAALEEATEAAETP